MNPTVRSLLYRRPELYELVCPEPNDETPSMCRRLFARYLGQSPQSILDIGCGTGRDLGSLSRECPDCWGVDYLPEMIEFARAQHPHLHFQVGDMRVIRLGRSFDVVMCMGSAFMYALTTEDIRRTLDTFVAHSHPGTLLILNLTNAASYLGGGEFKPTVEFHINAPGFVAHVRAAHSFNRRKQLLVRHRTWTIEGHGEVEDFCEYRLFFPEEITHLLAESGYRLAGMFDNMQLEETELEKRILYIAATFEP